MLVFNSERNRRRREAEKRRLEWEGRVLSAMDAACKAGLPVKDIDRAGNRVIEAILREEPRRREEVMIMVSGLRQTLRKHLEVIDDRT